PPRSRGAAGRGRPLVDESPDAGNLRSLRDAGAQPLELPGGRPGTRSGHARATVAGPGTGRRHGRPRPAASPAASDGAHLMTMRVDAGHSKLYQAHKTLKLRWENVQEVWHDPVQVEFAEKMWEPLEQVARDWLGAVERLGLLLSQVRSECE